MKMPLNETARICRRFTVILAFCLPALMGCNKSSPVRNTFIDPVESRSLESDRVEARRSLDSLIRRYERKKEAYERSEAGYYERLHMWQWTFAMLEARSNPGTFAGEMPGHEEFIYSDFIEAADTAQDALASYINRYVTSATESTEFYALLETEKQLKRDLDTKFPGSSSRMADANAAMQTEEYKAVAKADKEKLKEMVKNMIIQMGGDASSILVDFFKQLNR